MEIATDEIVSIEDIGMVETIDIEVDSSSRLFFCNNILTHNSGYGDEAGLDNIADSMGIAHTADLVISLTQSDTLKENDSIRFEILKSRISKTGPYGVIKIDYDKLKLMDIDDDDTDRTSIAKVIATKKKVVDKQEDSDKIEDSSGTVGGLT